MQSLKRDGVTLCLEEAGSGDPPLLLVHGWTCDSTYMAPQFEYFRRNHRVVAVDLRGHGQSDKPEQAYSMTTFAEDVVWLCDQLTVKKPVVVGHSMGGVIGVELAARFPEIPAAVVALDSPLVPPPPLLENLTSVREALRGPGYRAAQQKFVADALFIPSDDPALKARVVAGMSSAPQHVMASAFEQIFACDTAGAVAACTVPLLVLSAARFLSDLPRLRELCPHVVTGQTVGAGHFHQLEVPEQVNTMIERFLRVALPG